MTDDSAARDDRQYDTLTSLRLAYDLVTQMEADETRQAMMERLYVSTGAIGLSEALLEKIGPMPQDVSRSVSAAIAQAWEQGVCTGVTEAIAQCAQRAGIIPGQGESGVEMERGLCCNDRL